MLQAVHLKVRLRAGLGRMAGRLIGCLSLDCTGRWEEGAHHRGWQLWRALYPDDLLLSALI